MIKKMSLMGALAVTSAMLISCNLPAAPIPTETASVEASAPLTFTPTTPPIEVETPTRAPDEPAVISPTNISSLAVSMEIETTNPHQIKWSADSRSLSARSMDSIILYDLQKGAEPGEISLNLESRALDFSPDSRLAAFSNDLQTLELVDIESGQVKSTIIPGINIYGAVFLPGGKQIAILNADEMAFSIWDIDSGDLLNTYSGFETAAPVYRITFSEDGKTAIWFARATVQTTRLSSGQMGPVLSHQEFVGGLTTLDEKGWLAAASAITTGNEPQAVIQLWETNSGEEVAVYTGCEMIPISLDFSPNGKLLAADCQQRVILWDTDNQVILSELSPFTDIATSVVFSPDGRMLATASNDGLIRIWKINP